MSNKFEVLARWGYAARGVVYVILGAIALTGASSGGGSEASPESALSALLGQPFGQILLGAVAVGLIGHVLWRFAQAFLNADHQKDDLKGYVGRAGSFVSGVTNMVIAFTAVRMALGAGGGSGGNGEDSITAWLMQQPFGRFLVAAVGIAFIAAGAVQVWRGVSGKYRERVKLQHEHIRHPLSVFGISARGVLLTIAGGFFIFAAITVDPQQAGSLTDALDWVRQLPFGAILYSLAALGLVAFGLYSFIQGRYRIVDAPDATDLAHATRKLPGVS